MLNQTTTAKRALQLICAFAMVGVVHVFIVQCQIPKPEAWWIGAMIYSGLVGVLLSRYTLLQKIGVYLMFVVVTIVGAITVCPCTGAHFVIAPIAGLIALSLFHTLVTWPLSILHRRMKRDEPSDATEDAT